MATPIAKPPRNIVLAGATVRTSLTSRAYALAMALFGAGADRFPVPVTKDLMGPALGELRAKRVVERLGMTLGRHGKPALVKLVVARDQLVAAPSRASRESRQDLEVVRPPAATSLRIDELEAYLLAYRNEERRLTQDRSQAIWTRIGDLQPHLAVAQGDDFRNTVAMANAAVRDLDDLEQQVRRDVLARLQPQVHSPMYAIWLAMSAAP